MARKAADQLSYLSAFARKKITASSHGGHGGKPRPRTFKIGKSKVEIFTTYKVFVDGRPLKIDLEVADDGSVICHSLPFYRANSAVDVVRYAVEQAIAAEKREGRGKRPARKKPKPHHGHGHRGGH